MANIAGIPFAATAMFKTPAKDMLPEAWRILIQATKGKTLFPQHVEEYHRKMLRRWADADSSAANWPEPLGDQSLTVTKDSVAAEAEAAEAEFPGPGGQVLEESRAGVAPLHSDEEKGAVVWQEHVSAAANVLRCLGSGIMTWRTTGGRAACNRTARVWSGTAEHSSLNAPAR